MEVHDQIPWYRQFWPWFLIAIPGFAVVASLYTVSLAYRTSDSLVTVGDGGVDVVAERDLAAEQHAMSLGLSASVSIDRQSGAVTTVLHAATEPQWPRELVLLFSHPTLAVRDMSVSLVAAIPNDDGEPVWAGHLNDVPDGRWYLVIATSEVSESTAGWRLNGAWSGEATVRLRPASVVTDDES
jgi:hypothetical protein